MTEQERIGDTAAEWLMRREEAAWSSDDERDLKAWMDQSMAHRAAFWRLEHGWRAADRVAALAIGAHRKRPLAERGHAWRLSLSIAASLLLLIGSVGTWLRISAPNSQLYATSIGDRRLVHLRDGSKVELNTDTSLRAAMADQPRTLWLDKGEAYFDIVHTPGRPFIVHAGRKDVVVIGTKFAVRRAGDDVIVSVSEGRVRVDDATEGSPTRASSISAGDVGIFRASTTLIEERSPDRVAAALAWRQGMLVFDRRPLAAIAEEFNRYNSQKLIIEEPVGQMRIGGAFRANDVVGFADLLHDAYGLRVTKRSDAIIISS